MAPSLYGGGYARMYVHGASFCILRVEWHRPCMGAVMPGCMSMARRSASYALNGAAPVWGWVCPDVCPRLVLLVSYALNGAVPVWGRLCPDVCPWRVVLHLTR